jgi:hypothetical protein
VNLSAWCSALLAGALLVAAQDDARPPVLSHPVDVARPAAEFTAVNKLLRESKCVRAQFSEEKRIKVLKRPLLASGSIVFSGRHGLRRATKEPFVQELLVTPTLLAQRDAAGRVERVDVEKQPLAKGFLSAFLLVFSGDDQALAQQFEIYFQGTPEAWTMGFVPRKKPLSKFIASLVVTGKQAAFETLSVVETNGDRTLTRFTDVVTDRELTDDERKRWFEWDG